MARSSSSRTTEKKAEAPRRRAATGSGTAAPEHPPNGAPTAEEIAHRAYEIYLSRGGVPGDDVEDWLQAERELTAARSGQAG